MKLLVKFIKFSKTSQRGIGLPEVVVSILVLSLLMLTAAYMYQRVIFSLLKAREGTQCTQLAELVFSKLKTIDYYLLFNYDSTQQNFGLSGTYGPVTAQTGTYPFRAVLREIDNVTRRYGIDSWKVSIKFKIRDISDVDGDGLISDLRYFRDVNNDRRDDFDPSIRYQDVNGDGDFNDTYNLSHLGEKTCSELPDTNLKEVTLEFLKGGRVIYTQQELISLEMLSGVESKASGADIKLLISQPENNAYLYDLEGEDRLRGHNLNIRKSYPSYVIAYRADRSSPLRLRGVTAPVAQVGFYLTSSTRTDDSVNADMRGNFDFYSLNLTQRLREGENNLSAQATKGSHYSPYAPRRVILDRTPPRIEESTPIAEVKNRMPYVGARLHDPPPEGGIPSGICKEVITMLCNEVEVVYKYDETSGDIYWIDPATNLPPVLSTGTVCTIILEGGDRAHYKVRSSWTFTVKIKEDDDSPPKVKDKKPKSKTEDTMPEISCQVYDKESGIDVFSIVMKLNNEVVVSRENIAVYYRPKTSEIVYKPSSPLSRGSTYKVEISVSNWVGKVKTESWSFIVE